LCPQTLTRPWCSWQSGNPLDDWLILLLVDVTVYSHAGYAYTGRVPRRSHAHGCPVPCYPLPGNDASLDDPVDLDQEVVNQDLSLTRAWCSWRRLSMPQRPPGRKPPHNATSGRDCAKSSRLCLHVTLAMPTDTGYAYTRSRAHGALGGGAPYRSVLRAPRHVRHLRQPPSMRTTIMSPSFQPCISRHAQHASYEWSATRTPGYVATDWGLGSRF
jgi:hypothetical protein